MTTTAKTIASEPIPASSCAVLCSAMPNLIYRCDKPATAMLGKVPLCDEHAKDFIGEG